MDRSSLRQVLLTMLETNCGAAVPAFDDSLNLRQGLGLDSVDFVHLIIQIQSELGVELTPEALEPITTVGQLLDLVQVGLAHSGRSAA